MTITQFTMAAVLSVGWQEITVQSSRSDRPLSSIQRSLVGLDRPSERTVETLRRFDLERRYSRDVDYTLATLEKHARAKPDPELVYALAELSWLEGKRLDRWKRSGAMDRYLDSVAYSFDFLFDPELAPGRPPSDPRFRLACDLYNAGLDRLIRAVQSDGQIMPNETIVLKAHGKEHALSVTLRNSPWKSSDVDRIILASDFEVTGLNTRTYQYGIGVPLIAVRQAREGDKLYPSETAFPLTAFLRPNSRLRDDGDSSDLPRACTMELVDPLQVRQVGTPPAQLPVEADLTTPLAYMWSRTDLNRYRWTGLFRPEQGLERANLMLLRPYERGKIPVVMVHGLISSPLAWIPMINELMRDPIIQERYQFLLYMYPTGVSIPIAAAGLRESLTQARRLHDPAGDDPAFHQTVLLGHSMGGLLSRAMAVESGDRLWELNSHVRFEDVLGPPEVLAELRRYLFFQPLPFVRRVVFLATPHRGSDLSRNVIGRVGAGLIADPDHIADLLAKLIKGNPDAFDSRRFRRMPTSIETLDTDSEVLLALLAMRPGPNVTFHSIIGVLKANGVANTTDGVVPYRSSHIDGVASEVRVLSNHGVQKSPLAIREVRRILLEHIGSTTENPSSERLPIPNTATAPPLVAPEVRR
ncbi:MAG: esterase/lipase family protein [Isosphaeraceae bacterium]